MSEDHCVSSAADRADDPLQSHPSIGRLRIERLEIKQLARLRVDIGLFRMYRVGIFASDLNIVDEFAGCTTGDAGATPAAAMLN
jgi:hypothetical protein